MFSENLKLLRKQRGMSQEQPANLLNVVRQTVSKWEKGLSVPDADMLIRIAELFDVSVSSLLGEKLETDADVNKIAVQLALLNELLAAKERRVKRIWKTVLIVLICSAVLSLILMLLGVFAIGSIRHSGTQEIFTTRLVCTVDNERYTYYIGCDGDGAIVSADGEVDDDIDPNLEAYDSKDELIEYIKDYFNSRGGSVAIYEES